MEKKILDVTCGARTIWFDKHHPAAVYCDQRCEEYHNLWKNAGNCSLNICALGDAAQIAPRGSYDIAFKWDDSIITDKEERRKELYQLAVAGKFPMWRYYVECLGFPEKEAKEIAAELPQGMGDPYADTRIP